MIKYLHIRCILEANQHETGIMYCGLHAYGKKRHKFKKHMLL